MPIAFDVRTLFLMGALTALMCAGMLWANRRLHPPSRDALVWSAASLVAFGAAMGLIALRGAVPGWVSYPLANALGCAAAAVMYEGVRRWVGVRPLRWLTLGTLALLLGVQFALGTDATHFDTRVLLTSGVHAGFGLASVLLLRGYLGRAVEATDPVRWAAGLLSVYVVGQAARFVVTLVDGVGMSSDGMIAGGWQVLMPAVYALVPMLYALMLMSWANARIAGDLWALATVDILTGARTRRHFIDEARRLLAADGESAADGARHRGEPLLMMLDLDRFKQVNDRFGHATGDRVLTRFARLLREVAPPDALIGRYGGEEFCLLLRAEAFDAGRLHAQRICDAVRALRFGPDEPDLSVTVSIGVAGSPDGATLEELLIAADRRLYQAKASGRDRVVSADLAGARHDGLLGTDTLWPTTPRPAAAERGARPERVPAIPV